MMNMSVNPNTPSIDTSLSRVVNPNHISTAGIHRSLAGMAFWDSNPNSSDLTIVMLHPNSGSRLCFVKQMEDKRLTDRYRLIAVDLPGHGDSPPAENPERTYTFPGYVNALKELLKELGIKRFILLGWSLGGSIVIDALDQMEGIAGAVITGTPPIELTPAGFTQVFKAVKLELITLLGQRHINREEAKALMTFVGKEDWLTDVALASDGRARQILSNWIGQGNGRDQRPLVAKSRQPIAIIGGDCDLACPVEYLKSLSLDHLFMKFVEGQGHDVVMSGSHEYNTYLLEFLNRF